MNDFQLVYILQLVLIVIPTFNLIQVLVFILREDKIVNLFLNDPFRSLRYMPIPFLIYKLNFQVMIEFELRVLLNLT
jgi:hypothetical protein